jgi:hypothetical protein
MITRIEVNNRRLNHAYTLVMETGHKVAMPFMCDQCIKAARYRSDDDLLCIDHHLDKVWRNYSERASSNSERGEDRADNHSQVSEAERRGAYQAD